jgi:hypothetical protein
MDATAAMDFGWRETTEGSDGGRGLVPRRDDDGVEEREAFARPREERR